MTSTQYSTVQYSTVQYSTVPEDSGDLHTAEAGLQVDPYLDASVDNAADPEDWSHKIKG